MGRSVTPPATPDFKGASVDQTVANRDAALWSAQLSNPNFENPLYRQNVTWQGNIPTVTSGFNYNTAAGRYAAEAQGYQSQTDLLLNQIANAQTQSIGTLLATPFQYQAGKNTVPGMTAFNQVGMPSLYSFSKDQPKGLGATPGQTISPISGGTLSQNTPGWTPGGRAVPPSGGTGVTTPGGGGTTTSGGGTGYKPLPLPSGFTPPSTVRPGMTQAQTGGLPINQYTTPQQQTADNPYGGSLWSQFLATGTATQRQYQDNYWNSLPSQVQALRNLPANSPERVDLAQKLAGQGFAIDPQIMIQGQDPYMSIKNRMDAGYTWSPGLGQNAPPVAPGLNFPGQPSYDPNNPPPGSIPLNLDFAKGMNVVFPWGGYDATGKPFAAGTVPTTWTPPSGTTNANQGQPILPGAGATPSGPPPNRRPGLTSNGTQSDFVDTSAGKDAQVRGATEDQMVLQSAAQNQNRGGPATSTQETGNGTYETWPDGSETLTDSNGNTQVVKEATTPPGGGVTNPDLRTYNQNPAQTIPGNALGYQGSGLYNNPDAAGNALVPTPYAPAELGKNPFTVAQYTPSFPELQTAVNDYTRAMYGAVSPDQFLQSGDATYGEVPTAPNLQYFGQAGGISPFGLGAAQGVNWTPQLQTGLGYTGDIMGGPSAGQYGFAGMGAPSQPRLTGGFNESNVAQMPVNAGMTGQQALLSRIAPQLQMQRTQLETKLINQGLRPGDEAYNTAMAAQGMQENDAITQAALQGINLDIAANQQGFGQAQARAEFANQAAMSGFGAGLQGAQFGNQAIAQNFGQALQAQQAQNQAQQQAFTQRVQAGEFGNQAQLAAFGANIQGQQLANQALAQNFGQGMQAQEMYNQAIAQNQQAAIQQTQMAADLQNQGFSQAQAIQTAQNAARQQNFANYQTYQQSQNQAAAQAFQQQLAAAQFGNAAQQQNLQQQMQIRNIPINEITALMSGSQIALPQFQAYQGQVAQPGDIQAATGQQAAWNQNIYNQQVASRNMLMNSLFSLGGAAMGGAGAAGGLGKLFGCWIAEAIYGVDDLRTHLVRAWLNGSFKQTKFGSVVMKLYMKYGERIAEQVKKSKALKAVLKPVFDMALYCAIKDAVKKTQVA